MRRKYGTIFIAFVLVFVFQIVILDESFASFHTQQDACEITGNCPYPGNYGATPKNPHYHQIGTSIRANSIRQESDPQVTPHQYPYDPNSYAYNNNNNLNYRQDGYYDPYRAAAVDPSIYDPNSGLSYGGYTDPGYTSGVQYYNDPNVGGSYTYPNTGYSVTDPSTLGPNTGSYYYDPGAAGSYTDPSSGYSFTDYNDPPDDPEIVDDPGSGGGTFSGLGDFISGLDMSGIMNAAGVMGRMFGGQNALANAVNPLAPAITPLSTATNSLSPASLISETSTGDSQISTLPTGGIDANIGPPLPSTSNSETTTGTSSGTGSLSYVNAHPGTPISQNPSRSNLNSVWDASDRLLHTDTPIFKNLNSPNGLLDSAGLSSHKDTQASKNSNSVNSIQDTTADYSSHKGTQTSKSFNILSNEADHSSHSITTRNPNNMASLWNVADHSSHLINHQNNNPNNLASLWDAANYFNSNTEDNGKSDPMLIFTPADLNRSEMSEKEYTPVLSDDEIAKLYNSLGKKKRKSVLLLTDGDVNTPHELFNEIYPPVLEETGGNKDFIEKLGKHYQYIPLLEDLNLKLIPGLNSQTSTEDGESNMVDFSRIRKDNEDVMKKISDFYEVIPKEQDLSEKPAPGIDINSSVEEKKSISTRVRKDNEDFMKHLGDFYEYIPVEMNSSQKPITAIVTNLRKEGKTITSIDNVTNSKNKLVVPRSNKNLPALSGLELTESSGQSTNDEIMPIFLLTDDAESLLKTLNHSKQFRRDTDDVFEIMSEFYDFIPIKMNSSDQTAPGTKIHTFEAEKSGENSSERVRKHNQDVMKSMSHFYDFIPNEMNSSDQTAPGTKIHTFEAEKSGENSSERVRKHNEDFMKSMSQFYDFIPIVMNSSDQTTPGTKIYSFDEEKSGENNSEKVKKHNNDMIMSMSDFYDLESMSKFYDFIPIEMNSSNQTAPGTKIHTFEAEKSGENSSERVRKHNQDVMKSMSEFYDFIPNEMNSSDQTAPGTKMYLFDEEKSGKNNSERVKKHNNDMIMSMSDFYDLIPTGMNSFSRPSPGIHPHSTLDYYPTRKGNGNKIIDTQSEQGHGIMENMKKDESTSTPRFYRMIPKIGPFIKSGIDIHSTVKNYILEDLKSKFKSNFDLNDKLLVIGNGIEKSKEYFLAKKRDHITGEELLYKKYEVTPETCKASPITCEQIPNKYIFRLTCYDPHSHCPHTCNKSFILHFDCMNKISPLITDILKNVEKHHFGSSGCDTSKTCENHAHHHTHGDCFQKGCNTYPCSTCDSALTNQYNNNYNAIPKTDVNILPVPISTGNKEDFSIDYQDYKSPTENSYSKPPVLKETSSKNWVVNHSEQYEKSTRDDSVIYDSTRTKSYTQPISISSDTNLPFNSPYETPRSTTVQPTPKIDLNIISNLPTPQPNFKSENYQTGPDTVPKPSNFDSYYPPKGSPVGSSPPFGSTYEKSGTSIRPSTPKQDSNTWSSPPNPTFYSETEQSRPDALSISSNYEIERYNFHNKLPSHPPKPPVVIPPSTPCHECLNICQPLPTKCEQKICHKKEQACSKPPESEIGSDCEKCKGNYSGKPVHDGPQVSTVTNGRSSIMTISKSDNNKPKYVDKLKDMGLEQCKTIENSTTGIEKRISDAIGTLLNTSLQSCKDKEILSCHLSTVPGKTNKPCATIVKPACPGKTNGGACLDYSTAHHSPEIPKCHLKEHLCTKHTQEILKNQDSAKLVQGFECKKTIQSNCIDSPCHCKIPLPPASKECENLANFLEKISQTLDKSGCNENENKECKCKCST